MLCCFLPAIICFYPCVPSENTEQRKLAAIMFTDMVGYSALSQRNETLALELLAENQRLLRTQFPLFNGREVKTTGDGFLVEFPSALQATQCAVEIQRAVVARNSTQPGERHIHVRIGIHVGDVVHREADMYGDGVNIAARIEPLAIGGGICLSDTVYAQVRNKLDVGLTKLDSPELKHIEVPMDVYRVVLPWQQQAPVAAKSAAPLPSKPSARVVAVGLVVALSLGFLGWWLFHPPGQAAKQAANPPTNAPGSPAASGAASATDQKSIAVLAFVNMSADKENEYFSDGITEEILNALARTPGLRVAARTSAFSFKGKNESVQQIGEALKVGAVLEGSVRRAGNQLRITAQLISVADGFHLWSDTFDRKAEDVFAIQTEVAQRVQEVLKVKLLAGSSANATLAGTDDLEAYDLYLRGRHFWNQRTSADIERAVGLFQQATEKDPKFATAYAGLAASYALLPQHAGVRTREAIPKARAAARRALELDGRLAEAHAVLGTCAQYDWDWVGAEQEYQEALRYHATSHHWYAILLADLERRNEALREIRKAQALDPLSAIIQSALGYQLFYAGRYDEALVESDKALKLSPDFPLAYFIRGNVFLMQRKFPEAIAEFEKGRKKTGDTPNYLGSLGYAYARSGRTNDAWQILEKLKSISASGSSASGPISSVYEGLGDLDQAFVWLERAVETGDVDPRPLRTEPLAADLVKDPRYAALLKKFGLDK